MKRVFVILAAAAAMLHAADNPANPARRALLIGNVGYESLAPVPAAGANADLMARVLAQVGFQTTQKRDLVHNDMRSAIEGFFATIQPGDFVFLYFSGYGLQDHENEDNYLLPVSFKAKDGLPLSQKSYSMRRMLQMLDGRKAGTRMVILDASRSIPDLPEGLMCLTTPQKTLIASSTMPNQAAADPPGQGPNLFAQALAKAILEPGSSPQSVLADASTQVNKASNYKQSPFLMTAAVEPFYFVDPKPIEVIIREKPVQPGDKRENPKDGLTYVWIPAGTFKMGCVPGDKDCKAEERSPHDVKISVGFWMTGTEVTSLAYEKYAVVAGHALPQKSKTNPRLVGSDLPVNGVSWQDAQDYCVAAGGRLPTEAQWEYGARGGLENKKYPWGDNLESTSANWFKSDHKRWPELTPVRFVDKPNGYNLYGMAGNASEWVNDYYAAFRGTAEVDPQGPTQGQERVIKGGSFNDDKYLRISARDHRQPGKADNTTGFRCVVMTLK